jgi:hypothetical protein
MQIMEMPKTRKEKLDDLSQGEYIAISPEERASYSTEIQRSFHGIAKNKKRFTIRTDKQTGQTGVWRLI